MISQPSEKMLWFGWEERKDRELGLLAGRSTGNLLNM